MHLLSFKLSKNVVRVSTCACCSSLHTYEYVTRCSLCGLGFPQFPWCRDDFENKMQDSVPSGLESQRKWDQILLRISYNKIIKQFLFEYDNLRYSSLFNPWTNLSVRRIGKYPFILFFFFLHIYVYHVHIICTWIITFYYHL